MASTSLKRSSQAECLSTCQVGDGESDRGEAGGALSGDRTPWSPQAATALARPF